ncbi:hypothetical protein L1A70_21190 [Acinetobacter bereziniae]|uniref:POTRA domain-containing protein n=1 Tax=Acinetobacter bereziniae TaxID=106648 RepID=UPI0037706386
MTVYSNRKAKSNNRRVSSKNSYILILLGFSFITHAEISVPDSGTIVKQLIPESLSRGGKVDQQYFDSNTTQQNYSQDQTSIWVAKVELEGNQKIETVILHDLVKHLENKNNILADLQMATDKITQYYKDKGYFLAKAYLPKQKMDNGILRIRGGPTCLNN